MSLASALLLPAPIPPATALTNQQDLIVSGLSTAVECWEFEGRVNTSEAAIGFFTIQPNDLATDQASVQKIVIGGGSEFNIATSNLALADNTGASAAGFISLTKGRLVKGNGENWSYAVEIYQHDGAGDEVLLVVTGDWAVPDGIDRIGVRGSVPDSIRTGSWLRVRQVLPIDV